VNVKKVEITKKYTSEQIEKVEKYIEEEGKIYVKRGDWFSLLKLQVLQAGLYKMKGNKKEEG
jgi:hypothetical protein